MSRTPLTDYVTSIEELGALYPAPSELAIRKQITFLDKGCREFLAASPFFVLATFGSQGADCSPRGGTPGFVRVSDDTKTLYVPDRAGNNRLDSLQNIVVNPEVGLLFLVPGITYTLRVNGTAKLSVEPGLLERFSEKGKAPRCVIEVEVTEAYTQCAKAIIRSGLWEVGNLTDPGDVPTMGEMLAAHTNGGIEAKKFDEFERTTIHKHLE